MNLFTVSRNRANDIDNNIRRPAHESQVEEAPAVEELPGSLLPCSRSSLHPPFCNDSQYAAVIGEAIICSGDL